MYAIYISISKYLGQPSLHNTYITGTLHNRLASYLYCLRHETPICITSLLERQSVMGTFGRVFAGSLVQVYMMTSSNRNIFRVTGPLCVEFTDHRWIPRTKASAAELRCFLWSAPWINGWVINREVGGLRRNRALYDVIVMKTEHDDAITWPETPIALLALWKGNPPVIDVFPSQEANNAELC